MGRSARAGGNPEPDARRDRQYGCQNQLSRAHQTRLSLRNDVIRRYLPAGRWIALPAGRLTENRTAWPTPRATTRLPRATVPPPGFTMRQCRRPRSARLPRFAIPTEVDNRIVPRKRPTRPTATWTPTRRVGRT